RERELAARRRRAQHRLATRVARFDEELRTGEVTQLSLHLGLDDERTGYTVLLWLDAELGHGQWLYCGQPGRMAEGETTPTVPVPRHTTPVAYSSRPLARVAQVSRRLILAPVYGVYTRRLREDVLRAPLP